MSSKVQMTNLVQNDLEHVEADDDKVESYIAMVSLEGSSGKEEDGYNGEVDAVGGRMMHYIAEDETIEPKNHNKQFFLLAGCYFFPINKPK